jgi:hypothetical protein
LCVDVVDVAVVGSLESVTAAKGGLGKDKSVETRRGLHVVCDGERVVEDGVYHVKTERTRVGSGRLPSDIDQVTNRSGCRCVECQCRHERGGEGSKCSDSSEHVGFVNGV